MRSALLASRLWALLSAFFAALTAIFAKVGIESVNSDLATFIRTVVILLVLGAILAGTRQWQPLGSISGWSYLFLVLSGLATGGSWVRSSASGSCRSRPCATPCRWSWSSPARS
jgi:transporter family protein